MLVREFHIVVMRVPSNSIMAVRAGCDMCVSVPPTGDHHLRDQRGGEQDR